MKFLRKNALFLGMLAAFLVLFGISLWLLVRTISDRARVAGEIETARQDRDALWSRKPFPSKPNVDVLRRSVEEERAVMEQILREFRKGTLDLEPTEELETKQRILVKIRQLSELLDHSQIKHPERFQFGFGRYVNYPPKKEHTPLLLKQLQVMEEIIRLAAESHVQEILVARRAEFEDAAPGGKNAGFNPAVDPLISCGGSFEVVDLTGYLYRLIPFEIEFMGDTDALRHFLNGLSTSRFILLPRILTIENEKKEGLSAASERASSATSPAMTPSMPVRGAMPQRGESPVVPSNQVTKVTLPDPSTLPFVLGQERIKVGVRIDWLEFRPEKASIPHGKKAAAPERGAILSPK